MFETVGNLYVRFKIHSLKKLRENAVPLQYKELHSLILHNKRTEYLKPFQLRDGNYAEFAANVPIVSYEQIKHFVQRMMCGEQNILCAEPIMNFAKSSGTTDVSKHIPVSNSAMFRGHFLGGRHLLAAYFERFPNNKIFSGKHLVIGGSATKITLNPKAYSGDVSALLTQQIPSWIQKLRTPDLQTALLANWDEKLKAIAEQTFRQNVTGMSGVPSWSLELLKAVVQRAEKKTIAEVWKNFEFYVHGGVNFSPYQPAFENILGKKINYVNGYNASEGFFGFSDGENTDELLLMPAHGVFFEFREIADPHKIAPLEDVQKNIVYELIISTNSGLWRYALGDTVSFVSLNPYRFVIEGRTKQYINIAGEELMVHNAETAMIAVCNQLNCSVKEFSAAPFFLDSENVCHQWFIEFERQPESIELFNTELDKKLQELNSDYNAKRKGNHVLKELQIVVLPNNFFRKWLSKKARVGAQFKVPRLSNNRKYADDFLELLAEL